MSTIILNGGTTATITNTADIDLTGIEIVNDTTPQLGGDLDAQLNNITELTSLTFNNTHPSGRDVTLKHLNGGQGLLVQTTVNGGNNRVTSLLQATEDGGTTKYIGGIASTYSSTDANKKIQLQSYDDTGNPANTKNWLEYTRSSESKLRSDTIRLRKADDSDMLTVKDNSSAVGGADATLYGTITIQPENLSTETDLSVFQLKPDYGSNTIPDGADVKLNFQVRNDADGPTTLGKFSAVYNSTAADRRFKMESPTGTNSMSFYDTRTAFTKPVALDGITTTERDALSPSNGWMIYNSTNNRFEFYQNGGWVYYTATSA